MTPSNDELNRARTRFALINLAAIAGTVVCLTGVLIWQSDRIVQGGSIIGLPIALLGLFVSFWAPKYLARLWRTPPGP
jgi:hypothetical protein